MQWDECLIKGVAQISCLEIVFTNVVQVLSGLAGMVFLIMATIAGFNYLTSAGDPKKMEAAQGTLTAALVGIVLLVSAFIILQIISGFTGLNLGVFQIINVDGP